MLAKAARYAAPSTREEIIDALVQSGIEPNERWIEYQEKYGGMTVFGYTTLSTYVLDLFYYLEPVDTRSTAKKVFGFLRELVTNSLGIIDRSRPIARAGIYGVKTLIRCGTFERAQFHFHMDEGGSLYADDQCIASSLKRLLLYEAVGGLMLDNASEWLGTAYHSMPSTAENHEAPPGMREIRDASDEYGTWWSDGRSFVSCEPMWGDGSLAVRIFAQSAPEFEVLKLWLERIIGESNTVEAIPWPYQIQPRA
jgi:hypothetical protein